MGWTSYHAEYYKHGKIDRKAECDKIFTEDGKNGKWEVLKSVMHGGTYYAAVRRTRPDGETYVFGAVCLTHVDMNDWFNFSYKDMDESVGPYNYDCPPSILDMLSPTEKEYALEWRRRCRERAESKRRLEKLPVGAAIEFEYCGRSYKLEKRSPMYQFKTPWWWTGKGYFPKASIPTEYRVV